MTLAYDVTKPGRPELVIGRVAYSVTAIGAGWRFFPRTPAIRPSRKHFSSPEAALKGRVKEYDLIEVKTIMTADDKINAALEIAKDAIGIDGAHHKQWALDQICRALAGNKYEEMVAAWREGEDGPNTYTWDTGIAP